MSTGSKRTQSVDPQTRNMGLLDYQNAQQNLPTYRPFDPSSITQYLNPYTSDVINTSLASLGKQNQQALEANDSSATAAHAFGGDRSAVLDSLTNNDYANQAAQLTANLNSQNYNNAANMAEQNYSQSLQYPLQLQDLLNKTFATGILGTASQTQTQSGSLIQGILGALGSMGQTAGQLGWQPFAPTPDPSMGGWASLVEAGA